jgi:hypothetical protein
LARGYAGLPAVPGAAGSQRIEDII